MRVQEKVLEAIDNAKIEGVVDGKTEKKSKEKKGEKRCRIWSGLYSINV